MRFLASIVVSLILAYGLAFYLTVPANPETRFWRSVDKQRDREIQTTRNARPDSPILFFTGGSSCAFSIDPKIIEDTCEMPAFNLGLPVSAGARYLIHQALDKCRKGDILVVCLEPDLLTYPSDHPASSFSFGLAVLDGAPSRCVGGSTFDARLSPPEYLNLSRPGPGYLATLLVKSATGGAYRYQSKDQRYHGRLETQVHDRNLPFAEPKLVDSICPTGSVLLQTFRDAADRKGVRIAYSMPWLLTSEAAAPQNKTANLRIMESISAVIPTVNDGFQGVATDPRWFSDSGLHLSSEGAALRSKALADPLRRFLVSTSR